jgi:hypothetical protein
VSIEDQLSAFESVEKAISARVNGWERLGTFEVCRALVSALEVESLQVAAAWLLSCLVSLFPMYFSWLFELGAVGLLVDRLMVDSPEVCFLHLVAEIVENWEFDPIFIPLVPRLIEMISNGFGRYALPLALRIVAVLSREESVRQICIESNLPSILKWRRFDFDEMGTDVAFRILILCDCEPGEFDEWALEVFHSKSFIKHSAKFMQSSSFATFLRLSESGALDQIVELTGGGSGDTKRSLAMVLFAFLKAMIENGRADPESCGGAVSAAVRCLVLLPAEEVLEGLGIVAKLFENASSWFLATAIDSQLQEVLGDLVDHENERISAGATSMLTTYF